MRCLRLFVRGKRDSWLFACQLLHHQSTAVVSLSVIAISDSKVLES